MDTLRKKVRDVLKVQKSTANQQNVEIHQQICDNGFSQIENFLDSLRKEALEIDSKKDEKGNRKKRKKIIQDTTECIKLLLEIHHGTFDSPIVRFRQNKDVYPLTLVIGKHVCEIVCKLCKQTTKGSSTEDIESVTGMGEIPGLLDDVMGYLTPEPPTDLSDTADIEGVSMEEIKECRTTLHICCIEFCTYICKEMKSVLKVMKISLLRTTDGFKKLLVCVVKQYLYIQRASGLAQELLKYTTEEERRTLLKIYRTMFQRIRRLFHYGLYALRTIGFDQPSMPDVKAASNHIRTFRSTLVDFLKREKGAFLDLTNILREIQNVSVEICGVIQLGTRCLPPGEEQIEEDVTVLHSFESQNDPEEDSENETSSDFEEIRSEDDENGCDFLGSLIKISPEENEEIFKSSDIERTEVIQSYSMDGFKSSVEVCVNTQRQFNDPSSVGGKVLKDDIWIPAENVRVQGEQVRMKIVPGKYFVVHQNFPSGQSKFKKEEVQKGVTMPIPEAVCSLTLPPCGAGDITVTYKVHLPDKNRIRGYQQENAEDFGPIDIQSGLQTTVTGNIKKGIIELPKKNQPEDAVYVLLTTDRGFKNWDRTSVKPVSQRSKLLVEIPLQTNSISFIIKCDKNNESATKADQDDTKSETNQMPFLDRIQDCVLTLLGLKSRCKLLTLYKIPDYCGEDENEHAMIDLRIHCIESQRFLLNTTANTVVKNGWIQIQDGDESSDFVIRSGDKITLGFSNVKPIDGLPKPTMTFLKGGCSFADTKLQFLDKKHMEGSVMMYRKNKNLDWKLLVWKSLREKYEKYEGSKTTEFQTTNEKRRTLQEQTQKEMKKFDAKLMKEAEHVLNNILSELTDNERETLKKELKMTAQKDPNAFMERLVAHVKSQDEPIKFLFRMLKKINRENLVHILMDSLIS